MVEKKTKLGNVNACKRVDQMSLSGKFIKTWNSLSAASKSLGINVGNISSCLTGRRASTGGFKWSYKK